LDKSYAELKKFDNFSLKGRIKIDQICRKAAGVFSSRGYATATLADVAHEVGISKGGIYHYFSTKEELLFVILCRYMDHTLESLRMKFEAILDPREKIRTVIVHHMTHYHDNLDESRLILHETENLPPDYLEIIKGRQREYIDIIRAAVEEVLKETNGGPLRIKLVVFSLIGMCNWPYTWFDPYGPATPEELAEVIYDIFMGELGMTARG
jgi:AcrR family transcriptional regulator